MIKKAIKAVKKLLGSTKTTYYRKTKPATPVIKDSPTGIKGDSGTFGPAMKNVPNSKFRSTSDGKMRK